MNSGSNFIYPRSVSEIVAKRLVEHLERSGLVVMPPLGALSAWARLQGLIAPTALAGAAVASEPVSLNIVEPTGSN
jgi:hypothetical protein